ncbi:Gluconate transport-inducing protein [Mycoemilia scoparia]|uniref:Gluconate transport-inducing protein n=1 Tax=Mycoemilia scoparia TaxID=417184 RepID=A0A9W7ZWS5_9FUNG|nr:Gluconate transport-inducing protein [Mycoemilia scoparia]
MTETYYGFIETSHDALLVFEACRLNLLTRVQRRFGERERQSIRSGSVFVWDEEESGMRRWTDGRTWSPSRVHGSFLIYYELEGRRHQFVTGNGGFPLRHNVANSSPASSSMPNTPMLQDPQHYGAHPSMCSPEVTPKKYGLIKKSLSLFTKTNRKLHLICYYSPQDVATSRMPVPSSDPRFAGICPSPEIYPELNHGSSRSSERIPSYSTFGGGPSPHPHHRPGPLTIMSPMGMQQHPHPSPAALGGYTPVATPTTAGAPHYPHTPHHHLQQQQPMSVESNGGGRTFDQPSNGPPPPPVQSVQQQPPQHYPPQRMVVNQPSTPAARPPPHPTALTPNYRRSLPCVTSDMAQQLSVSSSGSSSAQYQQQQYANGYAVDSRTPRSGSMPHIHHRYHSNPGSPRLTSSSGVYDSQKPQYPAYHSAPNTSIIGSTSSMSSATGNVPSYSSAGPHLPLPHEVSSSAVSGATFLPTPMTPTWNKSSGAAAVTSLAPISSISSAAQPPLSSTMALPAATTPSSMAGANTSDCGDYSSLRNRRQINSLWSKETKGLLISVPSPDQSNSSGSGGNSPTIRTSSHLHPPPASAAMLISEPPGTAPIFGASSDFSPLGVAGAGGRSNKIRLPSISALATPKSALPLGLGSEGNRGDVSPPHTALPSLREDGLGGSEKGAHRWSPYSTVRSATSRIPSAGQLNILKRTSSGSRFKPFELALPINSEDKRQLAALKPDL